MELHRLFMILIILVFETHCPFGFVADDNGLINAAAPSDMCATFVAIHGYKCHEYEVITDDGYILSVQRIPEGRVGGSGQNRQPVLLQHGILVDGVTWVMNSAEQSLPMILADSGFDVWIANTRGTRYSLRHLNLHPNNPDYWNWSWDDLVVHDLPTVVNLVYKQTGHKTHYVGHSLGTLIPLASFSEGTQIDKIKSAALLSPIAYLSHMTTALAVVTARFFLGEITTIFGLAEFNPTSAPVSILVKVLCAQPGVNCYDFLTALTGKNCCLNASTVDLFLKNEPQSTSTKNFVHLAQIFRYNPSLHSVVELEGDSSYKSCDISSTVNSMSGGNDVVKLNKPGTRYFACGTAGHCGQGMKLKITTVTGSAPSNQAASSTPSSSSAASLCFPTAFFTFVAAILTVQMALVFLL